LKKKKQKDFYLLVAAWALRLGGGLNWPGRANLDKFFASFFQKRSAFFPRARHP
jgi:hypothetical protein